MAVERPSLPEVAFQGLPPGTRRVLVPGLYVGLALAVFALAWLVVVRPVAPAALVLAAVSVGQVIASLGAAPGNLRPVQGQPGAPRPLGSTAWYYGLSGVLMALGILEVGIGLVALAQEGPIRFLILAAAALSAFTAVLGALSAANLTKYTRPGR